MAERRVTVKEAAELYDKNEDTIRRWCADGKMKAEKDPGGRDWLITIDEDVFVKKRV